MLSHPGGDGNGARAIASSLSRRAFLRRSSAAALAIPLVALLPRSATAAPAPVLTGIDVRPRSAWAEGLGAPGGLEQEAPGDVRFLIVHHSASPNGYAPDEVPGVLRGFHAFHTGPEKGWPDVAYNFFVDRYGTVWEGRAGSLAGPVKPDATGGSQGFSQICCFVGDHSVEPPTAEAQQSMVALLAALAGRYGIDPAPGRTTSFVSRGSNRWPAGTAVTAPTISGHRDVSLTTCPGDAAYSLVRNTFPPEVTAVLAARVALASGTAGPVAPPPPGSSAPASTPGPGPVPDAAPAALGDGTGDGVSPTALVTAGVLAAGTTVGVGHYLRRHREAGPASAGTRAADAGGPSPGGGPAARPPG